MDISEIPPWPLRPRIYNAKYLTKEEKIAIIKNCQAKVKTPTQLQEVHGIKRGRYYKWLKVYLQRGTLPGCVGRPRLLDSLAVKELTEGFHKRVQEYQAPSIAVFKEEVITKYLESLDRQGINNFRGKISRRTLNRVMSVIKAQKAGPYRGSTAWSGNCKGKWSC
jgi:hypothetical protein